MFRRRALHLGELLEEGVVVLEALLGALEHLHRLVLADLLDELALSSFTLPVVGLYVQSGKWTDSTAAFWCAGPVLVRRPCSMQCAYAMMIAGPL